MSTDRLLKTEDAAEKLATSEQTLRKWRCAGKGPRYVTLGRSIRYRETDLEEYIRGLGGAK